MKKKRYNVFWIDEIIDSGLQLTRKLLSQVFLREIIRMTGTKYLFPNDNGYLPTIVNTNPFLYRLCLTSIVTIHRLRLLSNTTGANSGARVAYTSGASKLTLVIVGFMFMARAKHKKYLNSILVNLNQFFSTLIQFK